MTIKIDITSDLQPRVIDIDTGETLDIVDLQDASADVKAAVYGQVAKIASNLSTLRTQMKDQLEGLFHDGVVESAKFYGGVKLTRSSSRKWDDRRVGPVLDRLVADGTIKEARAAAAAPAVEVRKPDGRKLNALLQELAGTDAGADLASTKTDAVNWKAEVVEIADVPVADAPPVAAAPAPVVEADPVDAFFDKAA